MKRYLTFEKDESGYNVIFKNISLGEIYPLEDGIYVWEPDRGRGGALQDYILKEIYDKLRGLNIPREININLFHELEKQGVKLSPDSKLYNAVLKELILEGDGKYLVHVVNLLNELLHQKNTVIVETFDGTSEIIINDNTMYPLCLQCSKDEVFEMFDELGIKYEKDIE